MPFGTYTISATRRYLNVSTPTSSASKAFYVLCSGWECLYFEGSFVYRLNDNGQDVFSRFSSPNSIQYATTAAGEFVSRSRLISNGCLAVVANCFAETDPRTPVTPTCSIPANTCYTIQVQKTGQRLQAMSNNTVNQQPANNQNNQIWKAEDRGNGWRSFTAQDGTNRAIQAAGGANYGEILALTTFNNDGRHNWASQCNPADNSLWRIVYPNNNYTWDLRDFGNQPVLQIYGNTSEPFYDYRSFRFQPVGCPGPTTGCNFSVSASNSTPNVSCGQSSQLSFNCAGTDCGSAGFNWSGNGLNQGVTQGQAISTGALNSNGGFTYTLTASKAGCGNSTAPTSVNVTGCGTTGLALATVSYDCNSGAWTWQYTGGNGGSIETYCPGAFSNRTISANSLQTVTLDINLRNGTTFYITAIQGGQTYNFQFLSSCSGGGGCYALSPSASNANPGCNVGVTLNANCGSGDCSGVTYAWSGNGLSGGGSSIAVTPPASNGTYTYTVSASKSGCSTQTGTVAVNVSGCGGGLAFQTVSYNCNTGVWQWQFTGGNGSSIETYCPGAFGNRTISANSVQSVTVDVNLRNGTTFNITAVQSGQTYTYQFTTSCGGPRVGAGSEAGDDWQVSPNPSTGQVTVRFRLAEKEVGTISVATLSGQHFMKQTVTGTGQPQQLTLSLDQQPGGLYLVRLQSGTQNQAAKVLLIR